MTGEMSADGGENVKGRLLSSHQAHKMQLVYANYDLPGRTGRLCRDSRPTSVLTKHDLALSGFRLGDDKSV